MRTRRPAPSDALRADMRRFWRRIALFLAFIALSVYAGWFAPWSRPSVPPVVPIAAPGTPGP